jgi:hypothetical protein
MNRKQLDNLADIGKLKAEPYAARSIGAWWSPPESG